MLLPILFLFKTKISDYFKYSGNAKVGNSHFFGILNICGADPSL